MRKLQSEDLARVLFTPYLKVNNTHSVSQKV